MAIDILNANVADLLDATYGGDKERIFFGALPEIERVPLIPVAGRWCVTLSSRGPYLVSLGAFAGTFSTRAEAEVWRRALPQGYINRFFVSLRYFPMQADLERLAAAPPSLDVPCVEVEIKPIPNDGAIAEGWREAWASKAEALQRISTARAQGWTAEIYGVSVSFFSRDVEGLVARDEFLKSVNGDVVPLAAGTAWGLPEFSEEAECRRGRMNRGDRRPGPYSLTAYVAAEERPIKGVKHSSTAVFGRAVPISEYASHEEAEAAGWALLAKYPDAFAVCAWPVNVPEDPAVYCVARADRAAGGKLIPGSRLTGFFTGATRHEDAYRPRDALRASIPDACVFCAVSPEEAERILAVAWAADSGLMQ
jgi:hypothetical protein